MAFVNNTNNTDQHKQIQQLNTNYNNNNVELSRDAEPQESVKRIKIAGMENPTNIFQQTMVTPEQRATKYKRLEDENIILKERLSNMEKLLQQTHKANEDQVLQNNRFGPIIDPNLIEIDPNADENLDPFETVKRAIKRKNTNITINTEKQESHIKPKNNKSKEIKTKTSKPPPLHIHNQNIKDTIQLVKGAQIENFEIRRVNNNKHSLIINDMNNYDKMKSMFKEVNTSFFTFTPKELKPKSIVLKGLNEEEDITELKASIESQENIKVINITQLKTKRSIEKNIKLPLYIIQCSPETDMTRIFNIKTLNHQRITWENLKKNNDIMQCRNCQRLGHAATNCNLQYRCVKCSTQHKPGECQIKDKVEKVNIYCVNCRSTGHPASFKGCPTYQTALQRLKLKIKEKQDQAKSPIVNKSIQINAEHGTFADILKQNTTTPIASQNLAKKVEKMAAVMQQQSEQIAMLLDMISKL